MPFRKIHDSFWSDPDTEDWTPERKYFYIYLITNDKQTAVGVMQMSIKRMSVDLGYNTDMITQLVDQFEKEDKIYVDYDTKEIYVNKFYKYNKAGTNNHFRHLEKEIEKIKSVAIKNQVIVDIESEGGSLNVEVSEDAPKPEPSTKELNIPFEKIWSRYSRSGDKEPARKYWHKMSDDSRQEAWDGLDAYLMNHPEPKYRKHLVRYLKNKAWLDEEKFVEDSQPKQDNISNEEVGGLF